MSKKILAALFSLRKKVTGRLEDKKDLRSVAAALNKLAVYFYSAIPELSSLEGRTGDEINLLGEHSLIEFADLLAQLPAYSPEPVPLVGKKKVRYKLAVIFTWITGLFCHDNLLVKFFAWWILIQSLVILALVVAWRYVTGMKLDSTIISLSIGTPLLVSAAALAAPLRKK